jgi:hypothetical protein
MDRSLRRIAVTAAVLALTALWLAPLATRGATPARGAGALPPGSNAAAPAVNSRDAAAHHPRFDDNALWPKLTGKEYFLKEKWPKARLLVWAKPGTSGGATAGRGALDATDPKNWLEDGKTPAKVVLDENTDLVLPASETRYRVGFRGSDIREVVRHVTVESGAAFVGGGDGVGRSLYGNVWVKRGGGIDAQGATRFLGGQHVFFRNDNTRQTALSMGRGDGIMSSQYFQFKKENNASVEFLGHVTVLDEFQIYGCTVIVGVDSLLQPGRNASPAIHQGGVLALLDGALFESWNNDFGTPEMVVNQGTIQGGLPDRPLTRSCRFGLAFKNHTAAQCDSAGEKTQQRRLVRVPSLVVFAGALRSYAADPAKARLVFSVMADEEICPKPGTREYESSVGRNPENKALYEWMMKLPRGNDVFLGKDVVIENIEFDHLRRGGLMLQDPAAKDRFKNLFFGPACASKQPADLFSKLDGLTRGGGY